MVQPFWLRKAQIEIGSITVFFCLDDSPRFLSCRQSTVSFPPLGPGEPSFARAKPQPSYAPRDGRGELRLRPVHVRDFEARDEAAAITPPEFVRERKGAFPC